MMKRKIYVPPIKTQGIKTKLVEWIINQINFEIKGRWIEPFMGSGVVGFNLRPKRAIFADKNPHIINFYDAIKNREITSQKVKIFLEREGRMLLERGEEYYYEVRDRFNKYHDPLDFLFLNRSCFNGVIRFNSKGEFNTPFGKKPDRFRKAYITKIANQVRYVEECIHKYDWIFIAQDFRKTIMEANQDDVIYCDPPYIGRHTNYFDIWTEQDEYDLYKLLSQFKGKFILSIWYKNKYRENEFIKKFWNKFNIITRNHFYHVGGKEINRNPMIEALVLNFEPNNIKEPQEHGGRRD
ncbi:DNA adenine methylase [Rhodothermus marinus]|uniref:Site-specific DNA-methyltransferase (adenine-specific) n=1 Tax=Rhodothermus marinus (strain ATCC 43812 / DSM 4252 / R-10) TaxID=518766 RepID=D0MKT8_RHOM4|nr:Dam family site-specific DNA-(adenine-N6)-methyltransferase [Rhodothermus marinus]ACY49752.1 DNA adenine methylase [Rhodothermus marinus DSM 4252]